MDQQPPNDQSLVAMDDDATCERVGAHIIDLAGVRVRWGRSKQLFHERCKHMNLIYDTTDRRVWCDDCKRTIENFDALMVLIRTYQEMLGEARRMRDAAAAALASTVNRRAVKHLDKAWSGQVMAVGCPHCRGGLLPEDFADGVRSMTSRDLEIARRKRARESRQ